MHEGEQIGFVQDTTPKACRIIVIDLKTMEPLDRQPEIDSGEITNMFIDGDMLYFQQGNFYDEFNVQF